MKNWNQDRGVTLVELLIAMVIGFIAFFALTAPFMTERSFWSAGRRQAEAQRDATLALRAMARLARQSQSYTVSFPGGPSGPVRVTFNHCPCGASFVNSFFEGGPTLGAGRFEMTDSCVNPGVATALIDGNRSRVAGFTVTAVNARLLNLQLVVSHEGLETESLETQLFLRNAP